MAGKRNRLLAALLVLAALRGVIYAVVVPPWQHYDEPTHFEYARLIAERGRLPRRSEYDLAMRRTIAASMRANGFWRGTTEPALDFTSDLPPNIGFTELSHPPLYYLLLAAPQPLLGQSSVETQLVVARLGSVLLSLPVVAAAYGITAELLPRRRWLPAGVATFVALLPTFTDLMSSVNNDAGATAVISLLLWTGVRLVRRGLSARRLAAVLLLAVAGLAVKRTAGAAAGGVVAMLVALGAAARRGRWPGAAWLGAGAALCVLGAGLAAFEWGGQAAHWQSRDPSAGANRLETEAPLGQAALVLARQDAGGPRMVFQELPQPEGRGLRGHTVTAGAWIKGADGSGGTVSLSVAGGPEADWITFDVTPEWEFYAITTTLGAGARGVGLHVALPTGPYAAKSVYVDGLVLVEGSLAATAAPRFDAGGADAGRWAGRLFTNLLANGSAEGIWPGLRTWIGNRTVFRQPVAEVVNSVLDWRRTGWVYRPELRLLFESFWGHFGWNHVSLPAAWFYPPALLSLASVAGLVLGLARRVRAGRQGWRRHWQAWAVLGAVLVVAWGGAVLRIHPVFTGQRIEWPVARYVGTAIVPTALMACLGWAEVVPRRWAPAAALLGLLALVVLDAAALWLAIVPYYYG